jgi:hypothetical protein
MTTYKVSKLFRHIEAVNGDRPWGRFLDAGTGRQSIRWVSSLKTIAWTAVTASRPMATQVRAEASASIRPDDRIVVGNWGDERLLGGERFDTVLMDYLVGSVEGYWPYGQELLFQRLRPLVAGQLHLTGVEPYVPYPADSEAGRIVRRIGCLRDASLLLAGERPYREFPMHWVAHQLERAGLQVVDARVFPNIYREGFINGQLDWSLQHIERSGSEPLKAGLRSEAEKLREKALELSASEDGLRYGQDYVITARASD